MEAAQNQYIYISNTPTNPGEGFKTLKQNYKIAQKLLDLLPKKLKKLYVNIYFLNPCQSLTSFQRACT